MITRTYTFILLAITFGFCSGNAFSRVPILTELILGKAQIDQKSSIADACIVKTKIEKPVNLFSNHFAVLDSSWNPQQIHSIAFDVFLDQAMPQTPFLLYSSGLSPPSFF
jgi:hypothetical protein